MVGEDVEAVRRQIVGWLQHFGLTSKAVSVDVHTDSERAVGELIGNSTGRYTFSIRRAFPQQHRSIGVAERTVRELNESLSVLRADLNAQGLDILFTHETLVDVLTYLALCNNHFWTSRGSDRSPLEMVAGRKLSKPVSSLFGTQVLAEIPDSVRQHSPLSTRNIECTFIHLGSPSRCGQTDTQTGFLANAFSTVRRSPGPTSFYFLTANLVKWAHDEGCLICIENPQFSFF